MRQRAVVSLSLFARVEAIDGVADCLVREAATLKVPRHSPFGDFRLIETPHLGKTCGTGGASQTGNILALTSKWVKLRELRPAQFLMNGRAGDKDKGFLVWEGTIQVAYEEFHGWRTKATNAA